MYRVVEGKIITATEQFLDEFNDPILPLDDSVGPKVTVLDPDTKGIVSEQYAEPDANVSGQWECEIGVPDLDLTDEREFTVLWELTDYEGATHKSRTKLIVEPNHNSRQTDLVVRVRDKETPINFNIPIEYSDTVYEAEVTIYKNNEVVVGPVNLTELAHKVGRGTTNVSLTVPFKAERLEPYTMMIDIDRVDDAVPTSTITYTVWPITPQIAAATTLLEQQINKANYQNIIPELEYTMPDLVLYLFRGLALFNQLPPRNTDFHGTNMQGTLLDVWITCSSYYALSAQLGAEGAMAFDFSGQSINLNIDRSPSLEAMLGRIEQQINDQVKEYKKILAKAGQFSGDGSIGGQYLTAGRNSGALAITRSPITKSRLTRRPFMRGGFR